MVGLPASLPPIQTGLPQLQPSPSPSSGAQAGEFAEMHQPDQSMPPPPPPSPTGLIYGRKSSRGRTLRELLFPRNAQTLRSRRSMWRFIWQHAESQASPSKGNSTFNRSWILIFSSISISISHTTGPLLFPVLPPHGVCWLPPSAFCRKSQQGPSWLHPSAAHCPTII